MLDQALDIFRLRQYFNVVTRIREAGVAVFDDPGFLADARRALLPLPFEHHGEPREGSPFPLRRRRSLPGLAGKRVALAATGGSGALASLVGLARALEERGMAPVAITVCSGSSLFGIPLAAGLSADEVAEFTLGLRPRDYLDVDVAGLLALVPRSGRGFTGLLRGEAVESTYRRLLGDRTLAELPIPVYAPLWDVEHNRVEYLGPDTHPDLPAARAVRLAIALPLFLQAVSHDGLWWGDGGVVDIFPVGPLLERGPVPDVVVAVNGFYPPGFAGEDAGGWHDRALSILYEAAQVRTCQQVQLAREHLARLEAACDVVMVEPVPYTKVRGLGFYRQFFDNAEWAMFMAAGRATTLEALDARYGTANRHTRPAAAFA
jgi:NTE family protein